MWPKPRRRNGNMYLFAVSRRIDIESQSGFLFTQCEHQCWHLSTWRISLRYSHSSWSGCSNVLHQFFSDGQVITAGQRRFEDTSPIQHVMKRSFMSLLYFSFHCSDSARFRFSSSVARIWIRGQLLFCLFCFFSMILVFFVLFYYFFLALLFWLHCSVDV